MLSGLLGTKTFWIGLATAAGGLATLLGGNIALDFSSVTAIFTTLQTVAMTEGWNAIMIGLGIITGRHALSKMG